MSEITRPKAEIIGKISPLALGVPQAALADENINKATMGQIIGRATSIKRAQKKDNITGAVEILYGLRGSFVAIPLDPKKPESRSSVLYLPEGLAGDLIDRFKQADDDGEVVESNIAMELFVVRAKNPTGYSWGARSLLEEEPTINDPVAALRAQVAKTGLQIEHKADETANVEVKAEAEKVNTKK